MEGHPKFERQFIVTGTKPDRSISENRMSLRRSEAEYTVIGQTDSHSAFF